eukprot:g32454.t1
MDDADDTDEEDNRVPLLEIPSEHKLRSENLAFDIDVWYPLLAPLTFKTIFYPLQRAEARAILHYYAMRFLGKRERFTDRDVAVLQMLETRLDQRIKRHFAHTGAFLRLCGRSPKDSDPLHPDRVWTRYQSELQRLAQ